MTELLLSPKGTLTVLCLALTFLGVTLGVTSGDERPPRHAVEMCIKRCVELGGNHPAQCKVSCEEDWESH